jgi:hypothetical protein
MLETELLVFDDWLENSRDTLDEDDWLDNEEADDLDDFDADDKDVWLELLELLAVLREFRRLLLDCDDSDWLELELTVDKLELELCGALERLTGV